MTEVRNYDSEFSIVLSCFVYMEILITIVVHSLKKHNRSK
jgi:hypothetical protein